MGLLSVDREKCIGCGICAEVCPKNYIGMTEEGIPSDTGFTCIACGHCVAVCPQSAMDHAHASLNSQVLLDKFPVLNAETAEKFLRARRSARVYKEEAVPRDKILKLLNIARLAPTGNNTQGLQYLIIDDKNTLQSITQTTITWMDEIISQDKPSAAYFTDLVNHYHKTGLDVILRNAPCFILALAEKNFARGRDNTHFSLAYAELFASSLELGTCYAGLVEACARSGYQPLLKVLDIPEELTVTGGIIVGYPKYRYKRLVDRSPLKVIWH